MEPDNFRRLCLRFADVSAVLNDADVDDCYRMSAVIDDHLVAKPEHVAPLDPAMPAMYFYMADGWSTFVASSSTTRTGDNRSWPRGGRSRGKYLLERGLVQVRRSNGSMARAMIMRGQRPMKCCNKSWNVLTSSGDFFNSLRDVGRSGIILNVYLPDGAMHQSCVRHLAAKHRM